MPRIRRRELRHRVHHDDPLTLEQCHHLVDGWYFEIGDSGYRTADDFRAGWAVHGERIMEAFLAEFPYARPFGWWFCEAIPKYGERRLLTLADIEAMDREWREEGLTDSGYRLHKQAWLSHPPERADCWRNDPRNQKYHFGVLHTHSWPALQESEAEYLERHDLLSLEETEAEPISSPIGGWGGVLWEKYFEPTTTNQEVKQC